MAADVRFWFTELRTPDLLIALARAYPAAGRQLTAKRPLLRFAFDADPVALASALTAEEAAEREADRLYWQPLREELEQLRHRILAPELHSSRTRK